METTLGDLGINRQLSYNESVFGKIRKLSSLDKLELGFLCGSLLALLAVLILTIWKLATVSSTSSDFTFAIVLLVNALFCIFYIIHGVLTERPYEIAVLVTATVVILLYLGLNYGFSERGKVKLARLIIAAIFGVCMIPLGVYYTKKYYVENHLICLTVGAYEGVQKMCKIMFFYYDVLKFDLQLTVSIVIFVLAFETDKVPVVEIVILVVGCVVFIAYFILGNLAVRKEETILSMCFFVLSFVSPGYVIYRIVKSAQYIDSYGASPISGSVLACAIMALICRVILIMSFVIVFRNFGKGLKEKVYSSEPTSPQTRTERPAANA